MSASKKPAKPAAQEPAEEPAEQPAADTQDQSSQSSQTAQATAAAANAVSVVREKLVAGEQMVLTAALAIIVVSWFIVEILYDVQILSEFAVLLSFLTVLAIWVHRWGHYDFGKGYRILIAALGISLAILALMNLLAWVRVGGTSDGLLPLLGRLVYWAGGVAAAVGAWQVFRTREE